MALLHMTQLGSDGPVAFAVGKTFHGSAGDDIKNGTNDDDTFNFGQGGNDTLDGRSGNDTFNLGATFTLNDTINGGRGDDVIVLQGDYAPPSQDFHITAAMLQSVETVRLLPGFDYKVVTEDGAVEKNATLIIDGSALHSDDRILFTANLDSDSFFILKGGASGDGLSGSSHADQIEGGGGDDNLCGFGGRDVVSGGAGVDTFTFNEASESTGVNHDHVTDFNATNEIFNVLPVITGVDDTVPSGALDSGSFNHDLAASIGQHQLAAQHAVLFKPGLGDQYGHTYLIIDANGKAGYQANEDIVVDITGATHLGQLSADNFISDIG